ncbi:MAG: sialate O-acetylesterase [Akkermansiaceae bacterium]
MKSLLSLLALTPSLLFAELTVASPFTDNAVLQRDQPIPVWGTSDASTTVTVKFAGQSKSTSVAADGKWNLKLDALPASHDPKTLTVSSPKNDAIELKNILVGEVWICSGQSNMQMSYSGIADIKALVPTTKNLRTFKVKNTVSFTEEDRCEGQWIESQPDSAIAFSFAYFLEKAAGAPVGIILSSWGSSSLEAWMPRELTKTVPHFKTMMEEFDANRETRGKITAILEGKKPWSRPDDIFLRRQTNILYNAMIHPLIPYGCRGLVWYQGERNTQSMHGMKKDPWFSRNSGMLKYGDTLKAWMQQYRKEWQREDFQFLIVMLPGYAKGVKEGPENPDSESWAWMRESQLKALEIPHSSVANTIDLGHLTNIHPKDKLSIGKRLALFASRDTLKKNIHAHGPIMKRVESEGSKLVVHFDHDNGLKTLDGKSPESFWITDSSGEWFKANAILSGSTVTLSSPKIKKPLYVRYAFSGKPTVNLVNDSNLPAYPFRTDAFTP